MSTAKSKKITSQRFKLILSGRGWYKHIPGIGTKYVCSVNTAPNGNIADEIYLGKFPALAARRVVSQSELTIADMFKLWIAHVEGKKLSPHTVNYYRSVAKKFEAVVGSTLRLSDLKPAHVHLYRASFGDVAVTTQRNLLVYLQTAMKFAESRELIAIKWGDVFDLPSAKDHRVHRAHQFAKRGELSYTPAEVRTLVSKAGRYKGPYPLKLWILLGINGALGQSDLDTMTRHHVGTDRLKFARGKTGIDRIIPLWPETQRELASWVKSVPKDQEHLFLSVTGKRLHGDTANSVVSKVFTSFCQMIGIESKGQYSLRRTFRTWVDTHPDEHAIDIIMGHESKGMGRRYVQSVDHSRLVAVTDIVRRHVFNRG